MAELTEKGAPEKAQKVVQNTAGLSAEELIEKYKKPALIGLGALVVLVLSLIHI